MTFNSELKQEYRNARASLIEQTAQPAEVRKGIDSTLAMCTANQAQIAITHIDIGFKAGILIESAGLSRKVPAYTGFDFSKVPKTHVNKITADTIGHIGTYNKELANSLKWRYAELLNDNKLVNQLQKHGFTKNVAVTLEEAGLDTKAIELVRNQTTTNKMIEILEMRGIKGGMHPTTVARELRPHIRAVFGEKGVMIDNIGKVRKQFVIDASGKHGWTQVKNTRAFYSTTNNYADIVARSSMLKAHRTGRFETLEQSNMVKEYRWVSSMSANMCVNCGMMHGQILTDPTEYLGGLHARCACPGARPVWKPETGLTNKSDEFYENQRDAWHWKTHKTKEYNKLLPKDDRIPNYNFLPKEELRNMPSKEEMYNIRKAMLG